MTPPRDAWDRLAGLIEYPSDPAYAGRIDACIDVGAAGDVVAPLARFRDAVAAAGLAAIQERYVEAFDLDPAGTLDIGWHLLGDAPERAAFLSLLREDLWRSGVQERGELPDHLPVLLRLIGREDEAAACELATFIEPAVTGLRDRLMASGNPYGDAIEAVRRMLGSLQRDEVQP